MAGPRRANPRQSYITITLDWSPLIDAGINGNNHTVVVGYPSIDSPRKWFNAADFGPDFQASSAIPGASFIELRPDQQWEADVEPQTIVPRGTGFLDIFGITRVRSLCGCVASPPADGGCPAQNQYPLVTYYLCKCASGPRHASNHADCLPFDLASMRQLKGSPDIGPNMSRITFSPASGIRSAQIFEEYRQYTVIGGLGSAGSVLLEKADGPQLLKYFQVVFMLSSIYSTEYCSAGRSLLSCLVRTAEARMCNER